MRYRMDGKDSMEIEKEYIGRDWQLYTKWFEFWRVK